MISIKLILNSLCGLKLLPRSWFKILQEVLMFACRQYDIRKFGLSAVSGVIQLVSPNRFLNLLQSLEPVVNCFKLKIIIFLLHK